MLTCKKKKTTWPTR